MNLIHTARAGREREDMRKTISAVLLTMIVTMLAILGGTTAAQAATVCESRYVNIHHYWAVEGADKEANGNFVWQYCDVSPGQDYLEIMTLGGNYTLHSGFANCATFDGLRVRLNLPGDDITVMVPCQSDGQNGKTFDIANRRFSAPTFCSYAPSDQCRAGVTYSMFLNLAKDFSHDEKWTSPEKFLGY